MANRAIEKDHALIPTQEASQKPDKPRGMTLDEINHQRALLAVRKEFYKDKILGDIAQIRSKMPFSDGGAPRAGLRTMGGIASRVVSGLGYLDYVLLGVSAFNAIRKVTGFFRRHKR